MYTRNKEETRKTEIVHISLNGRWRKEVKIDKKLAIGHLHLHWICNNITLFSILKYIEHLHVQQNAMEKRKAKIHRTEIIHLKHRTYEMVILKTKF